MLTLVKVRIDESGIDAAAISSSNMLRSDVNDLSTCLSDSRSSLDYRKNFVFLSLNLTSSLSCNNFLELSSLACRFFFKLDNCLRWAGFGL